MPVCPECKKDHANRKNGKCPSCGTSIMLYDGHWFLEGTDSPVEQILMQFEDRKSEVLKHKLNDASARYTVPRNHPMYRKELSIAAKYLAAADFDLDLVKRSIDILFQHPDYTWRTWGDSMATMWNSFTTAMTIARSERRKEEEEIERQKDVLSQIESREDLFE